MIVIGRDLLCISSSLASWLVDVHNLWAVRAAHALRRMSRWAITGVLTPIGNSSKQLAPNDDWM
jgi:hypothetical protein